MPMACVEAIPVPDSRKKADELFLYWLSEPSTQEMLRKELSNVCGVSCGELDDINFNTDGTLSLNLTCPSSITNVLRPLSPNTIRTPSPPLSSHVAKSPLSPRSRRSPRRSPHSSNLKERLLTCAVKNASLQQQQLQLQQQSDSSSTTCTEETDIGSVLIDRYGDTLVNEGPPSSQQQQQQQVPTITVLLSEDDERRLEDMKQNLSESVVGKSDTSMRGSLNQASSWRSGGSSTDPMKETELPNCALTATTKPSQDIPRFYFPHGKPCPEENVEKCLIEAAKVFQDYPNGEVAQSDFHKITTAMGLPLYWKLPLFRACINKTKEQKTVDYHLFSKTWLRITHNCHDAPARFVRLMASNGHNYLVEKDFEPLIQDIVDTHPGLGFLGSAPEFHQRYVETVISRIFYTVDYNWNGRITASKLRRSNFLDTLSRLEEEPDINQLTDYFSYEHFYVIYCKFWELDTDHNLIIDAQDLSRHEDHALTPRIINRLLSGVVTRNPSDDGGSEGKMTYKDFIWFLLSEEDKSNPRSIEYWFRCLDIDGDGVLSLFELVYFYEEVLQRLQELNIDCLSIENTICQVLDMVNPKEEGKITLRDLKLCKMTPVFFNTFANVEKYLEYEQRDPVAMVNREEGEERISDWDKYAAEQYEILLQEEQYEQEEFEEDLGEDEKEMLEYLQQ